MTYAGQATALRAPLYPLTLGQLDLIFGSYSLLMMRIMQVVVAILTAWVCAQTAAQLWGKNSRWATFGVAIFMPTLLFFTPQILTETFAAFFMSLFLYFLVRPGGQDEWSSLVVRSMRWSFNAATIQYDFCAIRGSFGCFTNAGQREEYRARADSRRSRCRDCVTVDCEKYS